MDTRETCDQLGIEADPTKTKAINQEEFCAISTAMKCLHFLIKHNVPHTTVFKDFIEVARDELGSPHLQHQCAGRMHSTLVIVPLMSLLLPCLTI